MGAQGIRQAGGAFTGNVRFAQIGACVKRGHTIHQMTRRAEGGGGAGRENG